MTTPPPSPLSSSRASSLSGSTPLSVETRHGSPVLSCRPPLRSTRPQSFAQR
jgi:hypothetical protein